MKQRNGNIVPIIMGDWNESIYDNNARELFIEFGLVDVFGQKYPLVKDFKTYMQGHCRIDFVLAP